MKQNQITGRDDFIILQALATAYALIDSLPMHCQESSNKSDMEALLERTFGPAWQEKASAFRHVLTEQEWSNRLRRQPANDVSPEHKA